MLDESLKKQAEILKTIEEAVGEKDATGQESPDGGPPIAMLRRVPTDGGDTVREC